MRKRDLDVFSPYNVLDALHIQYRNSKNENIICPQCGKKSFYMNMETGAGHCFQSVCEFRCNHTGYYAALKGLDKEDARAEMYAYMGVPYASYRNKGSYSQPSPIKQKKERKIGNFGKEVKIADIEIRNTANREIIKVHPLIDRHIKDMTKRGLTEEEILKLEYCSYGYSDENKLAEIYAKKGIVMEGVPGFYKDNGTYKLRHLKKGILIPFRDSQNRIRGFQLRKNNEELKTFTENGKKQTEKKCNWLSSTGLEGGTSIPAYSHYACDFVFDFNMDRVIPVIKNNTVTVTEGGMKGDIAHILSGKSIIALPGITAIKEFEKELQFLKEIGVERIEDAFDMDYLENPNVQKQRNALKELIEKYGFQYKMLTWETKVENHKELKGIDDYYAYHKRGI